MTNSRCINSHDHLFNKKTKILTNDHLNTINYNFELHKPKNLDIQVTSNYKQININFKCCHIIDKL